MSRLLHLPAAVTHLVPNRAALALERPRCALAGCTRPLPRPVGGEQQVRYCGVEHRVAARDQRRRAKCHLRPLPG